MTPSLLSLNVGMPVTCRGGARPSAPVRSYSLSGASGGDGWYRISVKHEPRGAVSGYLTTRLRPGTVLDAGAPRGEFVSGELAYSPDPLEPPPSGQALICCSRPGTDVVLDM